MLLHQLAPHLSAVKGWRRRNPESPAWALIEARWAALVDHAAGIVQRHRAGMPGLKHERQAAEMVEAITQAATASEVSDVTLSMYLLQDADPSRFVSDDGFAFSVARRVHKLAPQAVGEYWNHRTQRMTKVHRDKPRKASAVLASWLVDAFGLAGLQLAEQERKRREHGAAAGQRLADAIGAMQ